MTATDFGPRNPRAMELAAAALRAAIHAVEEAFEDEFGYRPDAELSGRP